MELGTAAYQQELIDEVKKLVVAFVMENISSTCCKFGLNFFLFVML
jgi:hypothetical protein